jgi:hypothetical protein
LRFTATSCVLCESISPRSCSARSFA